MTNINSIKSINRLYCTLISTVLFFLVLTWSSIAQARLAPSCVDLAQGQVGRSNQYFALVTNKCKNRVRLRLRWANAIDGNCVTLRTKQINRTWREFRKKSKRYLNRTPKVTKLTSC